MRCFLSFFIVGQETAYELLMSLVGSEMCIGDRFFHWLFAGLRGVFFALFTATRAAIFGPVHKIVRAHVINNYRPSCIVVDIKDAVDFAISVYYKHLTLPTKRIV